MLFEFATATRIIFGSGRVREAVPAAASFGCRALMVTGSNPGRVDSFIGDLHRQNVESVLFSMKSEPSIPEILKGIVIARNAGCDSVIGFGGGSALDGAKAIAALMTNPGDPLDYLEVVGKGNPLTQPCAPCICIPTTAGAGCEVTRNAVLISPEHRVKVSLRSPKMFPLLAVVDPELTHSLPRSVTASTGMDALTQLIEPFVSKTANPMTDAIGREGMQRAATWLRIACEEGRNTQARENMSLASLFGGLALTNAGLGAVHGLAAPLGGAFPVPHGVVCARLLPWVMDANIKALSARAKDSPALKRYDEVARILIGKLSAHAGDGVAWIHSLCTELAIPGLSSYGLTSEDLPAIVEQAMKASSMRGNPIVLTSDELTGILHDAL